MRGRIALIAAFGAALAFGTGPSADDGPFCTNGTCYLSRAAYEAAQGRAVARPDSAPDALPRGARVAVGCLSPREMLDFLAGGEPPAEAAAERFADHSIPVVFLLVVLGGLAANLTPCVLPLVPVNLMLIGRGWMRGAAYAVGVTFVYGLVGLLAALGGLAFGTLQSSPWFSAAVSIVFLALAGSALGFVRLPRLAGRGVQAPSRSAPGRRGLGGCFLLGMGTATLASACVEPILLATLLFTAERFAGGAVWALALPFALGAGLALPWPFAAAGLAVLPRPGAWMEWVKRVFALVLAGMAVWYGALAVRGFAGGARPAEGAPDVLARRDKPLFVVVSAPWCRSCRTLEARTLTDAVVVEALKAFDVRHVVIDKFGDLARHPPLDRLNLRGLPACVVLDIEEKEESK